MHKAQDKNTSDIIYHYTNTDALYGMLKDGKKIQMWASDFRFLNDKEELINGINYLLESINDTGLYDKKYEHILQHMRDTKNYEKEIVTFNNCCIISFSLSRDNLSQWRAYANGSNGIALGFDLESIINQYQDCLQDVIYKNKYKKEFFNTLLKNGKMHGKILSNCIVIKNSKFASEKEIRFIKEIKEYKNFRLGKTSLIPYEIISFEQSSLKEVWIAPNCIDKELQKMSLKMFLESCGYEVVSDDTKNNNLGNEKPQVKIIVSKIPLRES